jgi:hypothetical protein
MILDYSSAHPTTNSKHGTEVLMIRRTFPLTECHFCLASRRNLRPFYLAMTRQCSRFHFPVPLILHSVVLLTTTIG